MPVMHMSDEVMLRRMTESDAQAVAALEAACFSTPWTLADFEEDCKRPEYAYLVAEMDGRMVGYAGIRSVLDEAEVTTIAVQEDVRGRGIGRTLMRGLFEICRGRGVVVLHLEVRNSNKTARTLYESEGFEEYGRRKNYYRNPTEDALLMCAKVAERNFH